MNTNARSLCPKIGSLVDCLLEMDSVLGIVSETWLTDGQDLVDDIDHLALATGFRLLCKNREKNNRGFSHGGIALTFRESELMLKEVKLQNPERFEVIVAAGKVNGCGRKLVVVGCYIPPNYNICLLYTSPSPRD